MTRDAAVRQILNIANATTNLAHREALEEAWRTLIDPASTELPDDPLERAEEAARQAEQIAGVADTRAAHVSAAAMWMRAQTYALLATRYVVGATYEPARGKRPGKPVTDAPQA